MHYLNPRGRGAHIPSAAELGLPPSSESSRNVSSASFKRDDSNGYGGKREVSQDMSYDDDYYHSGTSPPDSARQSMVPSPQQHLTRADVLPPQEVLDAAAARAQPN